MRPWTNSRTETSDLRRRISARAASRHSGRPAGRAAIRSSTLSTWNPSGLGTTSLVSPAARAEAGPSSSAGGRALEDEAPLAEEGPGGPPPHRGSELGAPAAGLHRRHVTVEIALVHRLVPQGEQDGIVAPAGQGAPAASHGEGDEAGGGPS